MMKVISFSSDVKTRHAVGWVSILWFTSAVSNASQVVKLQTSPQVVAGCGQNVTLTCEASSSRPLDIKLFRWVAKNTCGCDADGRADSEVVCDADGLADSEVVCNTTAEPLVHRLSLTLLNVMPAHQGEYLCKLQSTSGAEHNTTKVIVQDCVRSYDFSIKESHAECWFSGVYPIGSVHWFQGAINFTHSASTKQEMDRHGRYNVSSSIDVKKGDPNLPFECTLWKPSGSQLSQTLPPIGKQEDRSSGSKVQLQWICVLVGIMTFMI